MISEICFCLIFLVVGYWYGRKNGYAQGHRHGSVDGRKAGTYWERRNWMDSKGWDG